VDFGFPYKRYEWFKKSVQSPVQNITELRMHILNALVLELRSQ